MHWTKALHSTCKVSICMNSPEEQTCFLTPACHACSTQASCEREIAALVNLHKLLCNSWHLNLRVTLGEIIHSSIFICMQQIKMSPEIMFRSIFSIISHVYVAILRMGLGIINKEDLPAVVKRIPIWLERDIRCVQTIRV